MISDWATPLFAALDRPLADTLGGKTAKAFEAMGIETVHDLLRHVPRRLVNGAETSDLGELVDEARYGGPAASEPVAFVAERGALNRAGSGSKERITVILSGGGTSLEATFFGRQKHLDYWSKKLLGSERGIFVGRITFFGQRPQLAHPAFAMITPTGFDGSEENVQMAAAVSRSGYIGLYPQTSKLKTWTIANSAVLAVESVQGLPDPLPNWVRERANVLEFGDAVRAVHLAESRDEHEQGKRRLIFDEAFATQVAMAYRRADAAHHEAVARPRVAGGILDALDARLPFTLTAQQQQLSDDLIAELGGTRPMQRLLQGEVGSGKTVVALRAMLTVVDAGGQAVLLAPTEVLAQQHAHTLGLLLGDLGQGRLLGGPEKATDIVLLTGSQPAAVRREALLKIASGEAGIVVGTHALLTSTVQFADLGLVVVDEQHRFGVEQRTTLGGRSDRRPHVLVMTATPIPRSVAMTVFGDLDTSVLTELPAHRPEVTTTVVDRVTRPAWVDRIWARITEEVAKGRQAFVVAPRITATESDDATSVTELAELLSEGPLAGVRVGVLHGKMPADVKEQTMRAFAGGEIDVLVATTVIEVGVDVPNASVMVVMDAERYGISQLHQLRGRIGRGSVAGVCLLVTSAEEGTPARDRLDAVAATRDGFVLAEVDLAQRREGDVLGTAQSGSRSSLRLLRVLEHADDIELARDIAAEVVAGDPECTDPGVRDYVRTIELLAAADVADAV